MFLNYKKKANYNFGVEDASRQLIRSLNLDTDYEPICYIDSNKLIGLN